MDLFCVTCPYRETGCLQQLPDAAVAKFSDFLTRYIISGKGKTIFNQGELVTGQYFLCRGVVKLTRVSERGEETIVDLLAPCSIIGGATVLKEGNVKVTSAVAVEELTEVAFLKKEDLPLVFEAYPELGLGFSRHLSKKLREAYRLIATLTLTVEERLLAVLARIVVLLTGKVEKGLVEIPISYRELAQFAQVTPETLSRTMRGLQDRGIISVDKKGLRVIKDEALKKYIDVSGQ
jgi:CRP-like cAMP-binding protein